MMVATIWLSGFWNTIPALRLTSNVLSSSRVLMPSMTTSPADGMNSPLSSLASVLLPLPFIPASATNSPLSTEKVTLRRARTVCPSPTLYE